MTMPPLPEPDIHYFPGVSSPLAVYTKDHLLEYGKACFEQAATTGLLEALQLCANKFKQYTDHHLAKGDEEKAAANALMLKMCETVIDKAEGDTE